MWDERVPGGGSSQRGQALQGSRSDPMLTHSPPCQPVMPPCPGPTYLSRLAAHKKVTEELAGRAPGVSGHKGKLAVGWAPGGVENSPQGVRHQEHLGQRA